MNKQLFMICKLLLVIAVFYSLFVAVSDVRERFVNQIVSLSDSPNIWYFIPVLLLLPLNWSLEALKWKFLLKKIESVSFKQSLNGVLSGLSIGLLVPQSIGDFTGRVINLKNKEKFRSAGALIISNFSQFVITLFAGLLSVVFLLNFYSTHKFGILLHLFFISLAAITIGLFFDAKWLLRIFNKIHFLQKYSLYIDLLGDYSKTELSYTLLLSALRYLVFSFQFVLVLLLMEVHLPVFELFCGVSFVFLAKTLLPLLNNIGDLGIRELSALFFFDLLGAPSEKILLASLVVWIINILLPSLVGAVLLLKTKYRKQWS